MTEIAYLRVSTKDQHIASQEADIKKLFPNAEIMPEVHGTSGTVPAAERKILSRLIDPILGLRKGDILIVWWVDRIGRDYEDAEKVVRDLLARGVIIKTLNQSRTFEYTGNTMTDMITNVQITMITAMAAAEREIRLASAEAGRRALRESGGWDDAFKGRIANTGKMKGKHEEILALLAAGHSMRETASKVDVSLSTVQRVKKRHDLTP
ncbi:recombinase family protein [Vibrio alginolyticus]|uniref:recombinase family protein n=1 Tax=Vibrio alginolyticus TaxID=663 RepID=UPI00215BE124|nr:recombinase family protein [Vibrio alginolyticus]ELB2736832.1 recombinase family protein [Vibrio alginolyticus]ELB2763868.1 recombinase family protein [Vibrio alginolyticus]MCR9521132.1 recombinase family protein [Vibrio alginolyticus]MCS0169349.1 recombinase family protein [Vibrio alginolyticus]